MPSSLRFRYQTLEFINADIHVRTLRDTQQYYDTDYHPEAERFMSENTRINNNSLSNFSKKMVNLDFSHTQSKPLDTTYLTHTFKGQLLRYKR
jgi:hypothetical protein